MFQDAWIEVIFEVSVIDSDAYAVQTERIEEYGIRFCKEIFQELERYWVTALKDPHWI